MSELQEAVIVSAARTPVGKFGGAFRNFSAIKLGTIALSSAIQRAGISPAEVEEVIVGNVLSAGLGQAPARQCAIGAG
ncbi:MAG: acetyl-CoA C-acyltransferase, partial [Methanomassiliicoccales archaeon]